MSDQLRTRADRLRANEEHTRAPFCQRSCTSDLNKEIAVILGISPKDPFSASASRPPGRRAQGTIGRIGWPTRDARPSSMAGR